MRCKRGEKEVVHTTRSAFTRADFGFVVRNSSLHGSFFAALAEVRLGFDDIASADLPESLDSAGCEIRGRRDLKHHQNPALPIEFAV